MDSADWIALAAAITALSALGFAVVESRRSQRNMRLSVKPHLDARIDVIAGGDSGFTIHNNGIGPAEIISASVRLDGNTYDLDSYHDVSRLVDALGIPKANRSTIAAGSLIPAGQSAPLITDFEVPDKETSDRLWAKIDGFHIEIKYQSLYEEVFEFEDTRRR